MTTGTDVPGADAGAFRGFDDERLARTGNDQLRDAVEIRVDGADAIDGQSLLAAGAVGGVLCRDEVLEGGETHV